MATQRRFDYALRGLIVVGCLILLNGCASAKVKYEQDPHNGIDDPGYPKFSLQASNILLQLEKSTPPLPAETDKPAAETKPGVAGVRGVVNCKNHCSNKIEHLRTDVTALSVPTEAPDHLYMIVPTSQWLGLVQTQLSVSYIDNTNIIHKIGSQVEDNRIKVVQALGALAGAAIPRQNKNIDPTPPGQFVTPAIIHFDPEKICKTKFSDCKDDRHFEFEHPNEGWFYTFVKSSSTVVDKSTAERDLYFKNHNVGLFEFFNSTSTVPFSACEDVRLYIAPKIDPEKEPREYITYALKVSNYKNVSLYRLPNAGNVTTHTSCGADITTDKDPSNSTWEVIGEIAKQVKAVQDAQKTAHSGGNKSGTDPKTK